MPVCVISSALLGPMTPIPEGGKHGKWKNKRVMQGSFVLELEIPIMKSARCGGMGRGSGGAAAVPVM